MARKDRRGEKKQRTKKMGLRCPKLGYYLIITDTEETEANYFKGMHASLPTELKEKLVVKVVGTKTAKLIDRCIELAALEPQYRLPWIVFDRDQIKNFDEIIAEAIEKNIAIGWSNPCFEIWLYAYYGTMPTVNNSRSCCDRFAEVYKRKTGQAYEKSDKNLYKKLKETGSEELAISIATKKYNQCEESGYRKPSKMCPCTTVHELVAEINEKVNEYLKTKGEK